MSGFLWVTPISGIIALLIAGFTANVISKYDVGNARMKHIAEAIQSGAMAFLTSEYRVLVIFVVAVAAIIAGVGFVSDVMHPMTSVSFLFGAACSVAAGFFGMRVATQANVRTAQAATKGMPQALRVAFSGGSVMGLLVVGLGLTGVGLLYIVFGEEGVKLRHPRGRPAQPGGDRRQCGR
ncbi:sodium/proton-translocating pyrophosphatase [Oscillochloris sp. ZM17-4]|nr:sodium/proton-translocating pyrophosphatase [Oscillochloris sp. ZM17-4]MBX0328650.1 sodium/proton-translocating pyrophosphatase [Oscillochloris sp. ZM17-4]